MPFNTIEMSANANGGTEIMKRQLETHVPADLLDKFHITVSRPSDRDESKINLFWAHDLPGDPNSEHLAAGGWNKYERLIFVSNWQMQAYQKHYGFPWYKALVLQNAIDPIRLHDKPDDGIIRIIYHTTPHRGLELLVPVFDQLCKMFDNIQLDVYSSFNAYGWAERDEPYKDIFEFCEKHDKINYHGFQPNDVVRTALEQAHIFAYPSIWQETSCMALMEAMSAGCLCIHPNFGALPETASNWTWMYQWTEDKQDHAQIMFQHLKTAIEMYKDEGVQSRIAGQKTYADVFYTWEYRKHQWIASLESMLPNKG